MPIVHEHPKHGRKAGQWAKDQSGRIYRRNINLTFLVFIAVGGVLGWCLASYRFEYAVWLAIPALALVFGMAIPLGKHIDRQNRERLKFTRGAQAEALVAWYMQALPDTYHIFHNLPCAKGGDVDHVVVGPTGLFVLSTKSHRGHVTRTASGSARLNGQPMDDLYEEAMRLALWVRDRLKAVLGDQVPWVQPILCLPHVHSDLPPTEGKVWLLNDQTLVETLEPEKPKSKTAAKRVELLAAELAKVTF